MSRKKISWMFIALFGGLYLLLFIKRGIPGVTLPDNYLLQVTFFLIQTLVILRMMRQLDNDPENSVILYLKMIGWRMISSLFFVGFLKFWGQPQNFASEVIAFLLIYAVIFGMEIMILIRKAKG